MVELIEVPGENGTSYLVKCGLCRGPHVLNTRNRETAGQVFRAHEKGDHTDSFGESMLKEMGR